VGNKRKYSEKQPKKSSTFFETCEVNFLGKSVTKHSFPRRMPESASGTYFVTKMPWTEVNVMMYWMSIISWRAWKVPESNINAGLKQHKCYRPLLTFDNSDAAH